MSRYFRFNIESKRPRNMYICGWKGYLVILGRECGLTCHTKQARSLSRSGRGENFVKRAMRTHDLPPGVVTVAVISSSCESGWLSVSRRSATVSDVLSVHLQCGFVGERTWLTKIRRVVRWIARTTSRWVLTGKFCRRPTEFHTILYAVAVLCNRTLRVGFSREELSLCRKRIPGGCDSRGNKINVGSVACDFQSFLTHCTDKILLGLNIRKRNTKSMPEQNTRHVKLRYLPRDY